MLTKLAAVLALTAIVALGCQTANDTTSLKAIGGHSHQPVVQDAPSTHGMLVFGDGPVYLSHLPMFHQPHDYQVLMEVDLQKAGVDPVALYATDRHVTGEKIYTFVPESFSLPELVGPHNGLPQRTTFKGTLFRGHFERGGSSFIANVTAKVKRVIYVKKFDAQPGVSPDLRYFVFGDEHAVYAAHLINKAPDFDHILSVRILSGVPNEAAAAAIRNGLTLDFMDATNDVDHALKEGLEATGTLTTIGDAVTLQVQPVTEFYLETGDLAE